MLCMKEVSLHRAECTFSPLQYLANHQQLLNAVKPDDLCLARKGTKCTGFTDLRQGKKVHVFKHSLIYSVRMQSVGQKLPV